MRPTFQRLFLLCLLLQTSVVLAAPRIEAVVRPEWVRVGQSAQLEIRVSWPGEAGRYVLYPPTLSLPSGLEKGALTQTFETQAGTTTLLYRYQLTASAGGELKPGSLELGTLSLRYRDPLQGGEEGGGTLEQPLPTLEVRPGGAAGLLSQLVPVGLGLLLLGLFFGLLRRRLHQPSPPPPAPLPPSLQALSVETRRALQAGREDEIYSLLLRIKPLLPSERDELPSLEQLENARLQARYGGRSAHRPELERLVDTVERLATAIENDRHKT
ncbi:MAG: hypothetical protein ACKO6N_22365 [Myxococcota bacterium]